MDEEEIRKMWSLIYIRLANGDVFIQAVVCLIMYVTIMEYSNLQVGLKVVVALIQQSDIYRLIIFFIIRGESQDKSND